MVRGERFLVNSSWWGSLGGVTFFFAAVAACLTFDLKRLIAISTLGHLGFMVSCLSAGEAQAGAHHLFTHAIFKSSLFIGAGDFIRGFNHSQDLRDIGQVGRCCPLRGHGFMVSLIGLAGIPFSGGSISKGAGLSCIRVHSGANNSVLGLVCRLALIGSRFYCIRAFYLLFCVRRGNSLA